MALLEPGHEDAPDGLGLNAHGTEEARAVRESSDGVAIDARVTWHVVERNRALQPPRFLQDGMSLQGDGIRHELRHEMLGDVVSRDGPKLSMVGVGQEDTRHVPAEGAAHLPGDPSHHLGHVHGAADLVRHVEQRLARPDP